MKALIKDKPTRVRHSQTSPFPKIGENDLLVRVHAAAICGTDIHIYQWNEYASSRIKLPLLFGHEYSAEVVEVGKNVTQLQKGRPGCSRDPCPLRPLLSVLPRAFSISAKT